MKFFFCSDRVLLNLIFSQTKIDHLKLPGSSVPLLSVCMNKTKTAYPSPPQEGVFNGTHTKNLTRTTCIIQEGFYKCLELFLYFFPNA